MKRNITVEIKGDKFIITETKITITELDPIGFIDNFNKLVQDNSQLGVQKAVMVRDASTMTPEKLMEKLNIKGLEEAIKLDDEKIKILTPYFQKARLRLRIAQEKQKRAKKK